MQRTLNYHHLRYFQAVAREGNLTRAAERLNLSQSALSAQIRKLEESLGQPLFARIGRRLELTEAGRIALAHAERIFATGEELVATLAERPVAGRARLCVGAVATLSRNFQVGFLRPLLGRGDVAVSVRSGRLADLLAALASHALDVVLANERAAGDPDTPFLDHRIAAQPVSLVARAGRAAPGSEPAALLAAEPVVAPAEGTSLRADFDGYCARLGLTPRIAAEVDDMAMLRVLAREDIGIAVVPPIVVTDELASGELVEAARLPELTEEFFAIALRRRFPNPLLEPLIEAAAGGGADAAQARPASGARAASASA